MKTHSQLYSTHMSRPRKRPTSTTFLRAIAKVMKAELSATAISRWHKQLDEAIGEPFFIPSPNKPEEPLLTLPVPAVSKTWCPTKPVVTRLLVNALVSKALLPDGRPVALAAPLSIGSPKGFEMAKIISRRLVELVVTNHYDTLRSADEFRADLFAKGAERQLGAAIARHATDVIAYVATRANELAAKENVENVVLEIQTVDQYLHGRETRGSGLVVCEAGMRLVEKAVKGMTEVVEADAEQSVIDKSASTDNDSDDDDDDADASDHASD